MVGGSADAGNEAEGPRAAGLYSTGERGRNFDPCPRTTSGSALFAATPKRSRASRCAPSAARTSARTARIAPWAGASAPPPARGHSSMETPMTMKTLTPTIPANDTTTGALTRRPRRLRRTESIRSLVRETVVRPEDLIYPLFVVPNSRPKVEIGRCRACGSFACARPSMMRAVPTTSASAPCCSSGCPRSRMRSARRRGIRRDRCSRRSRRSSALCRR